MRLVSSFKAPTLPSIASLVSSFGQASTHSILLGGLDVSPEELAQNRIIFDEYQAAKNASKAAREAVEGAKTESEDVKSTLQETLAKRMVTFTEKTANFMAARRLVQITADDYFAPIHPQLVLKRHLYGRHVKYMADT